LFAHPSLLHLVALHISRKVGSLSLIVQLLSRKCRFTAPLTKYDLMLFPSTSQKHHKDYVEIWKSNWLELFEQYRKRYTQSEERFSIMDVVEQVSFEELMQSLMCIKSHGSLGRVLEMIAEGDQGSPFRARVKEICEDEKLMDNLKKIWKDGDSVT
jgi:hypothetical protein